MHTCLSVQNISDSMVEVSLRLQNQSPTQHQLPALKQVPNSSTSIVMEKLLIALPLPFDFHSSSSG